MVLLEVERNNNNRLTISTTKTEVVLFGMRNTLKSAVLHDLCIGLHTLQYVKHFTYLGVKVDCNLKDRV